MTEVLREYLPAILVALVIGLIVGFLIFRPRQRVRLTDSAPVRPHMAHATSASEEPPALADTPLHQALAHPGGDADDFCRMKGVGPKFASA